MMRSNPDSARHSLRIAAVTSSLALLAPSTARAQEVPPRNLESGADLYLRPLVGLFQGPGVDAGFAYRPNRWNAIQIAFSYQYNHIGGHVSHRVTGTSPVNGLFEYGLTIGSQSVQDRYGGGDRSALAMGLRVVTGVTFSVAASRSLLVAFGPTVGGSIGLAFDSAKTALVPDVIFGFDVRMTFPLTLPPPPPRVRFVRVGSEVRVQATDEAAEITPTPAYLQTLPRVRHVAVRAPSNCENARVTSATGQAAGVGAEILHTTCGVEMAELERRLAVQGFIVTSWTTLSNAVETQHVTPIEAARQLGAQVLFQVNSLERTRGNANRLTEWEQTYRESNEFGDPGPPIPLPDQDRAMLRSFVRDAEVRLVSANRLGATLDVSAISVATGQSIWFFRWNHLQPYENAGRVIGLARQIGSQPWEPVEPRSRVAAPATPTVNFSARDTQSSIETGGAADAQQAQYNQLVRETIDRFVVSFSPGRVATEPLLATPPPAVDAAPAVVPPAPVMVPPAPAPDDAPDRPGRHRRRAPR